MKNKLVLKVNESELVKNFSSRIKLEDYVNNKCQELEVEIYDWTIEETIEKNKSLQLVKIHTVVLK